MRNRRNIIHSFSLMFYKYMLKLKIIKEKIYCDVERGKYFGKHR